MQIPSDTRNQAGEVTPEERSLRALRLVAGALGIFLPCLLIGIALYQGRFESSISGFYFTDGRDFLVGTLCAIGIVLITYKGYERKPGEKLSDDWLTTAAGVGMLGVAFIPTAGSGGGPPPLAHRVFGVEAAGALHLLSAGVFFLCLAAICWWQFPKHGEKPPTPEKRADTRIYRSCAVVITGSFGLMLAVLALPSSWRAPFDGVPVIFGLETVGVLAFALAWLLKSHADFAMPLRKAASVGLAKT